ncbi:hypothetical protein KOI35_36205 [Actinoplanes bogorensis]|uniref:Uncharacterized protein n=1 Tax=Paractinoplanes bogorensis TaxID=1610840 RepID=A0ABS5YZU2_9ACTN|nr:hypothetical protein [Actinoplanes bogorensis]MBU2668969.1 hypothetical protein [Actinoplanes bogorensis]
MRTCSACPHIGRRAAVGACSECRRPVCENHLVLAVEVSRLDGQTQSVTMTYHYTRLAELDIKLDIALVKLAVGEHVEAFVDGYAQGRNVCRPCRDRRGNAEVERARTATAAETRRWADRSIELVTCTDADRVMELLVAGVGGTRERFASAWAVFAHRAGPPTHDVVQLGPGRWRGRGRPRVVERTPVWLVTEGFPEREALGGRSTDERLDALLAADGRIWTVHMFSPAHYIPTFALVPHGKRVRWKKRGEPPSYRPVDGRRVLFQVRGIESVVTAMARHVLDRR